MFEWYLRVKGGGPFQAGNYDGLRENSSMGDVKEVLEAGPVPPKPVSFLVREGLWLSETRKLILETFPTMDPAALDAALAATHPPIQPEGSTNLEGFLFPATYEVPEGAVGNAQALVDQMLAAFERASAETGLPDATNLLSGEVGKESITPYEALIVASLVESEAKVPEDRAKIARVIYNRLAQGMTLGIDAVGALRHPGAGGRPDPERPRDRLAVQHPALPGAAAHADQLAGTGVHRCRPAPGRG